MSWQDDEDDTIPCPYCRRDIHEDAVRCPYCENYLSQEDAPPSRRSWWFLILALLCLLLAVGWALQIL
jgi:predicted nucleic acid-binding Zn ribbon protein